MRSTSPIGVHFLVRREAVLHLIIAQFGRMGRRNKQLYRLQVVFRIGFGDAPNLTLVNTEFSKSRVEMLQSKATLQIADSPPWFDTLTEYDRTHFTQYMQLLSASAENASEAEMAFSILDIDPISEFDRAHQVVRSHLARVNWLMEIGYLELFPNDKAD